MQIEGKTYDQEMPGFGRILSDAQVASLLSFVRKRFAGPSDPISPATVSASAPPANRGRATGLSKSFKRATERAICAPVRTRCQSARLFHADVDFDILRTCHGMPFSSFRVANQLLGLDVKDVGRMRPRETVHPG